MTASETPPRSIFEKIWDAHVIAQVPNESALVHVDRHVLHEVSSPRAFQNLEGEGRRVRNPELTFGTVDHIVSTAEGRSAATFAGGRELIELMRDNCSRHGIALFDLTDPRHGIVHMMAAELGLALPGSTVACGDSHTATVGGLGALAWGAGTSEVEHILSTQTINRRRPKAMRLVFEGRLQDGVGAKDLVLHFIGRLGTDGGRGHVVEYAGPVVEAMSVEERLTLCNMSIEFGARAGLCAPDEKTFAYLEGREFAPTGADWERALAHWRTLPSDAGAVFDREVTIDCTSLAPQITWGTSPQDVVPIDGRVPAPESFDSAPREAAARRALAYMGLAPGAPIAGTPVDVVFIGSCTNGRLSDLEAAAEIVAGRHVAPGVRALVVPGSRPVRAAAEALGLDAVFRAAGFEWREPGCSMCLSLNDDRVAEGERCVSTSNRNFEGRQGRDSRTHLASPETAAASALAGVIADHRTIGR